MSEPNRTGLFAAGASVFTALLASACCWLPLVFVSFGVSAAGVSGGFEKWRPVFLTVTAAFLGLGFYFAYFRKAKCESASACATPSPKLQRLNRGILWLATIAVLVFALFPSYAGNVLRGLGPQPNSVTDTADTIVVGVTGMTCEACGIHVERELLKVPGVLSASVIYADNQATVRIDPQVRPARRELISAVEKAGYTALFRDSP